MYYFNPRLREGGDEVLITKRLLTNYFNPRLREGGDFCFFLFQHFHKISIHASAKEATWNGQTMLNSDVDFNPRLREGGDGFYWSKHCKRCLISIHASAKEATFEHLLYVLDEHIFQSTPPRRRRPQHIVIPQLSCTYLVSTTFLSTFFSFISQYVVLFFLF